VSSAAAGAVADHFPSEWCAAGCSEDRVAVGAAWVIAPVEMVQFFGPPIPGVDQKTAPSNEAFGQKTQK